MWDLIVSVPDHCLSFYSSSCTTTELSKLLTSCLTAIKKHLIKYCEKVYKRFGKNLFWSIKHFGEVLNKLKSRGFHATSLSTYDLSTLYTTLPHNLINKQLMDITERTVQKKDLFTLLVVIEMFSSRLKSIKFTHSGVAKRCVKPSPFFWTIFILDLALRYADKL